MKMKIIIIYILFIVYININFILSLCPDNFIYSQNRCIGYESGISKLKVIYCHVKKEKDIIIGVFKNPNDNFTNIWYPKQDQNNNNNFNLLKSLPYYPESDEDTCRNQIKNFDYISIYKTQIIDLTQDLFRYLCLEKFNYPYFTSIVNAPCHYNTYLTFNKPYNTILSTVCNEDDESPNTIIQGDDKNCLHEPLFNQRIELGTPISYDTDCNKVCNHGFCKNSQCSCYKDWTGDQCNIKKCINNTDCDHEILNSECSNQSSTCKCKRGYIEINGLCQDENECLLNPSPCNLNTSICINTLESYRCECKKNFLKLNTTTHSTINDNNMNMNNNNNNMNNNMNNIKCLNIGSSTNSFKCNDGICECNSGYEYNNLTYKCEDVDECKLNLYKCDSNQYCDNINGSYRCKCNQNYILVNNVCEPLPKVYSIKTLKKGILKIDFGNTSINYSDGIKSFFFSNDDDYNDPEYNSIPCLNLNYTFNEINNFIECNLKLNINYNGLSFYLKLNDNTTTVLLFDHINLPFIKSIDNAPTNGGISKLELDYRNYTLNQIQIFNDNLNSKSNIFQVKSLKKNIITINVLHGVGILPFNLYVDGQATTDNLNYTYQVPFIQNFTTTNIKTGGNITIYGSNFGINASDISVSLKNDNSNYKIECLNVQLIKKHSVIKCFMPPSNQTQQLLWVKVNELVSNNLIYFYFNKDDSLYNCNSNTTCSNNGKCYLAQCKCFSGWVGPNCNERDESNSLDSIYTAKVGQTLIEQYNNDKPQQEIKTKNGTTFLFGMKSLIEYSSDGKIVEEVQLDLQADWNIGETITNNNIGIIKTYNSTLFNYAIIKLTFIEPFNKGKDKELLSSDTVQLLIYIESWPFQSRTNYLDIIMESQNVIIDKERPLCRSTSLTKYSKSPWKYDSASTNNEIIWYLTTNDYVSLYVSFINKIKIDSDYRTIKILKKPISNNQGNNTINVILRIPYFNQSISIDQTDYKIISNDKPYINHNLSCKVNNIEDKGSKKLIISAIGFLIGILILFSGVSIIWYIIRRRNLKKVNQSITKSKNKNNNNNNNTNKINK